MIKFTKERVLLLYKLIVEATGGTFGIWSENLLESAIEAPYQTFDGEELFPTKIEKAARLGYGLISNHPFIDGNKRIGVYIMISFLEVNGIYWSRNWRYSTKHSFRKYEIWGYFKIFKIKR